MGRLDDDELDRLMRRLCDDPYDDSSWVELYRLVREHLGGVAMRLLGDYHLAEDALSEGLLNAARAIREQRFDRDRSAYPWLRTVVAHAAIGIARTRSAKAGRDAPLLDQASGLASSHSGPDQLVEAQIVANLVLQELDKSEKRWAAYLYFGWGCTQLEVAEILGVSRSTVAGWIEQFRAKFLEFRATLTEASEAVDDVRLADAEAPSDEYEPLLEGGSDDDPDA